jgi:DNA-directed RNA polymerase subunit RPC12/RpoP
MAGMKFVTEIVTGDCPECNVKTMLVNIDKNIYRCVNCGEDVEQKVNGVIKYMRMKDPEERMELKFRDLDG